MALLLTVLAVCRSFPVLAAEVRPSKKVPTLKQDAVQTVDKNLSLSGKALDAKSVAYLEKNAQSSTYPVAASAAIVLSKHNPEKYREGLQDTFAVDDYAERSEGKYNIVPHKETTDTVKEIEDRNPAVKDQRVFLLLAFHHFRDQNKWFLLGDQRFSVARFFRGAFLSIILGPEEGVRAANRIDAVTRQKHEQKERSKASKDAAR